eukprot:6312717-Amphidinium_carterae.1
MQYVTENQFELLRKALWTSAIDSVQIYDANFWREVIRNGFDKYLQSVHDYPQTCYASISFTYDGEDDSSDSSTDSAGDAVEFISDVLIDAKSPLQHVENWNVCWIPRPYREVQDGTM